MNGYAQSKLGKSKGEILEVLKTFKYNDPEDMVSRLNSTHLEFIDMLGLNYIGTTITGFTLTPES